MIHFLDALGAIAPRPVSVRDRQWVFVADDQLTDQVGPLARRSPQDLGIVLVESASKYRRRPYHKQKLAWGVACQRAFALEQASRGVAVRHVAGEGTCAELLDPLIGELGPLTMMEAAERALRADLQTRVEQGTVEVEPNATWLTTTEQFEEAFAGSAQWRADRFYRHVRREMGLLMIDGAPEGGQYSFDPANRTRWRGTERPREGSTASIPRTGNAGEASRRRRRYPASRSTRSSRRSSNGWRPTSRIIPVSLT